MKVKYRYKYRKKNLFEVAHSYPGLLNKGQWWEVNELWLYVAPHKLPVRKSFGLPVDFKTAFSCCIHFLDLTVKAPTATENNCEN